MRVSGEIDLATAPSLRECLASVAGDLVVDLTDVSFVDSQAIGLLMAEHKRHVGAGDSLVITGSSPVVLRVFEITRFDQSSTSTATHPNPDAWTIGREEPASAVRRR